MVQIWLVRHGQSHANAGLTTSDPATIPLTDLGHQQARDVAARIDVVPDLIVTSPFTRAQQTAMPIRQRYPSTRHEVWPIHEFTYLAPDRCRGMTAAQRRPLVEAYWARSDIDHVDGPGAESFAEFAQRVADFHDRLTAHDGLIVVFGHEQFFRTYLLGLATNFAYTHDDMRGIGDNTHPPRMPNGHIHRIEPTTPAIPRWHTQGGVSPGWPTKTARPTGPWP